MRHIPRIWNEIWSNMYIETTLMRYGHANGDVIGITLQTETLTLSHHLCRNLETNLSKPVDDNEGNMQNLHEEEAQARIESQSKDREGI